MKTCRWIGLAVMAWLSGIAGGVQITTQVDLTVGTATQSSTGWNGVASRAIDGNTDGVYNNGSMTHTQSEADAWWQVVLPFPVTVDEIVIYNRSDCCGERLADFKVEFLDVAGDQVFVSATQNDSGGGAATSPGASITVPLGAPVTAKTIRIFRVVPGFLSLAEVTASVSQDVFLPLNSDLSLAGIGTLTVNQSSLTGSNTADRALDGNTASFTETAQGSQPAGEPWWQADIGATVAIQEVVLINRQDCCKVRLRDIEIQVLDAADALVATSGTLNAGGADASPSLLSFDFEAANGGNPVIGQKVKVLRTPFGAGPRPMKRSSPWRRSPSPAVPTPPTASRTACRTNTKPPTA